RLVPRPPPSTRFPYTTLFRSHDSGGGTRDRHAGDVDRRFARRAGAAHRSCGRRSDRHGSGCDADPGDDLVVHPEAARCRRCPRARGLVDADARRRLGPRAVPRYPTDARLTMALLTIEHAELMRWITAVMWPFVRIGALLLAAPLFGARTVPARIRVALALVLA